MPTESPKRAFKEAIYSELARISKSLSSPRRLELLDLLVETSAQPPTTFLPCSTIVFIRQPPTSAR